MNNGDGLDGALDAAFGGESGESIVARITRLSGVTSRVLLHDAAGEESPLLRRPSDQSAEDDARYQIAGEIARGGVGVVYKARDRDLGRDVALKVLRQEHAGQPDVLERLVEEAQIGGQLQHPGIVPVYGMGLQPDGRPYLAMKLIKGRTLAAILKKGDVSRPRLLRIFEQVCQTMAYAHTRGVIHRDLKPSNVMVGTFGEVQVVDWGFGKVLGHDDPMAEPLKERTVVATLRSRGEGSESLTGSVMGTPAYMPPEQALGQVEELDERSDVFSLGAILCEVLTGRPPYAGEPRDLLTMAAHARLDDAFARLEECDADPALAALCRRALAPLSADRPRNAAALAEAIEKHFAAADERMRAAEVRAVEEAARLGREQRAADWARRSKRKTAALATVVVLAVALAGGAWFVGGARQRSRVDRIRSAARAALDDAARLHGAGRWAEAAAKARSARDLAAQGEELAALRDEAEAVAAKAGSEKERAGRRDRLLAALEEARVAWADSPDYGASGDAYRAALRAAGLDPTDAAALVRGIRSEYPDAATDIAAALDFWIGNSVAAGAATRIDPDPWRTRLREAAAKRDAGTLRAMAGEASARDLPLKTQLLLGTALGRSGEEEAAAALFERLLADHPDEYAVQSGAFRWAAGRGDPADIAGRATAAVALRPRSGGTLINLGHALLGTGNLEGAAAACRAAIAIRDDFPLAFNNLGIALSRMGDLDGAIDAYREALRVRPDFDRSLSNLGVALRDKGELEPALAALREAVRIAPDVAGYHYNLGCCLADVGDIESAVSALREALRIQPDYADAHADLGRVLLDSGNLDESLVATREAIRLRPDFTPAYKNLGQALAAKGDLQGAIAALREAIRQAPDYADAHVDLGVLLARTGDPEGAIAALHEAIRAAPDSALAHYNLGNALGRQGDHDAAVAAFREAIRLRPDHARAYNNLASTFMRKGDLQAALSACREGIRVDPELPNLRCTLGFVLTALGRHAEALESLRKGHELGSRLPRWPFPSALWVANAEARVLYEKQRFADAAAAYERLAGLDPGRRGLHRYSAARSAVRAGTPEWRARSLEWLHECLRGKPDLGHWKKDPDLAAVRDRIDDLPETERGAWRALWEEVDKR